MTETRRSDWIAPALLIVAALLLGLVAGGIVYAVSDEDEPETIGDQLEAYTACLTDHGASVPVFETAADGGFVIIVPGSLLEGDVDLDRFMEARDACRHLEPNPLEVFLGGEGFDLAPLLEGFDESRFGDARFGRLLERCERLAQGDIGDPGAAARLRRLCRDLGG